MANLADSVTTSAANHYNALRADILTNHDHRTAGEAPVYHEDLADGALAYLSHEVLSKHVQGGGNDAAPDDPGGDKGVHGLNSGVSVCGSLGAQYLTQIGRDTTDRWTDEGNGWGDQYTTVTFKTPYSQPPAVFVIPSLTFPGAVSVYSVTANGFGACIGFKTEEYGKNRHDVSFMWIAVGVK